MTRSRYSVKESLNRLLRLFEGSPLTADTPNVIPGEVLSENEALSDFVELLEGSLPSQTATLPSSLSVGSASLPFASVVEANAGTSDTVVLSPASHSWAHEYGGIYINTGSADQAFTASTWTKITGAFQAFMEDSGGEINCDWNDDRIIINEAGTYFISYNVYLYSDGAARSLVDAEVFVSGSAALATRSRGEYIVTGSYIGLSAGGYVDIPISGYYVDLRLNPNANLTIRADTGQLMVHKAVG